MIHIILTIILLFLLLTFLLSKISPYNTDFMDNSLLINDNKSENVKYVEIEKIIEKPVEIIKEVIIEKPVEKIEVFEDLERIEELERKIQELENKNNKNIVYRNIGLELFQEKNIDQFYKLLKETIGKKVSIVTSSSFVLGANFEGYNLYEGTVIKYDIISDRFPLRPIIRFYVDVPISVSNNIQLAWIFDDQKFNKDFSSPKNAADFLKSKNLKTNIMLMEI